MYSVVREKGSYVILADGRGVLKFHTEQEALDLLEAIRAQDALDGAQRVIKRKRVA